MSLPNLTHAMTRRGYLRWGGWAACAASLGVSLGPRQAKASCIDSTRAASAKRVILVWLDGGPTHLETFDPKPEAPREIRGPFQSIATRISGVRVSEHLPRFAERLDHWCLIRSVTSPLGEHNLGTHYLLTGYRPTPAIEYPAIGAQIADKLPPGRLPSYVAIPDHRVGGTNFSGQGFLSSQAAPFAVGGDPAQPDFRVDDLHAPSGIDDSRLRRRLAALQALEAGTLDPQEHHLADSDLDAAFRLILTPEARSAFDLRDEPVEVVDRYGPRTVGRSCLLARRLIERDVPFVLVNDPGWDTHEDAVTRLRDGYTGAREPVGKIPALDLALAGLIDDLHDRNLLDSTLVVVMGEFGRTPKLNTAGGRDHWPRCFTVAMAGGGVRGGQVIGESDSRGESPQDSPVTPADLTHSLLRLVGLDPAETLQTPDGRPIARNRDGSWIAGLTS